MDVLCYLARHPEKVVSRQELEQAIWNDSIVGYDALTRCIAQLRKALGDNARAPAYIATIAKKGYRLIAPVKQAGIPVTDKTKPARPFNALGPGLIVLLAFIIAGGLWINAAAPPQPTLSASQPAAQKPSVAILAFQNLHQPNTPDYFSAGLSADLTTELSKLSGLDVIAHHSSAHYPAQADKPVEINRSLHARYLLMGSVRRSEQRIRLNVRFVDSRSNKILWSERYDRELQSLFDVQDDITRQIIDTLAIQLNKAEQSRIARRYTNSVEAYDDFLKAQAHYMRHTRQDNRQAIAYFRKALQQDPNFARAWSALALSYAAMHRHSWGTPTTDHLTQAHEFATQGLRLDPQLPQAHWVLAYIRLFQHDYENAALSAEQALHLNPNYADSYLTLAICRLHEERAAQAISLIERARLLNPQYPAAYASILGQAFYHAGNYSQAAVHLSEAIERNHRLTAAHVYLIATLEKQGLSDEAGWAAEQLRNSAPGFTTQQLPKLLALSDEKQLRDIQKLLERAAL